MIARLITPTALALLTCAAAMALHHITQPQALPSQCPGLIATWQAHSLPAHLQIKCREYLK